MISSIFSSSSKESTPFPLTSNPPMYFISEKFPFITSNLTSFISFSTNKALDLVANTPTGSNTTGLLNLLAIFPAF